MASNRINRINEAPETISPDAVANGVLDIKIGKELVNSDLLAVKLSLDKAIAKASELLTLKTGDIVYLAATEPFAPHIGERVEVALNGTTLLDFEVK